jgi:Domain of unknown function (DUF6285)
MQYEPSAAELLAAISELLEEELLPAVPEALKHKTRVAGNLARILERQEALGPAAAARERERLVALVGEDAVATDAPSTDATATVELARRLAQRVRTDDDPAFEQRAWDALVAICRDDLAIAKPGHDAWEGP